MNLEGIEAGTRLVTVSGDVVELLSVSADGTTASVRFVDVLGGADVAEGDEASLPSEEIATVDGNRFVGPGRTSSYTGDSRA